MKTFESNKTEILAQDTKIFNFLSDFNNFKHLLPPEVTNWKSDADSCSFTVQNMASLSLKIDSKKPSSFIYMKSVGANLFEFNIQTTIEFVNDEKSIVQVVLNADLNPMISMLASRPLENLVKLIVEKLKEHMEK